MRLARKLRPLIVPPGPARWRASVSGPLVLNLATGTIWPAYALGYPCVPIDARDEHWHALDELFLSPDAVECWSEHERLIAAASR